MKLYGVMIVQNEGDIIEDTLEFLRQQNIYERIFFYDLDSQDDTFTKANQYTDILHEPTVLREVFTDKLKYDLLAKHKDIYQEGDWLAIIDADEFYFDDPVELIKLAEEENATCIKTYQAQFMFTDVDLSNFEDEDQSLPIYERRKHYIIDWSEERFYKYLPDNGIISSSKPCSVRLLNRHYQYRTPPQIKTRIIARLENKIRAQNLEGRQEWLHMFSDNWNDYIFPHKILNQYDGNDFKFGIPQGIRWKDYCSKNPSSVLIPQIATALKIEKGNFDREIQPPDGKSKTIKIQNVPYEIGKGWVSFQNRFADKVIKDIKEDVAAREWIEVILGLVVLLKLFPSVLSERIQCCLHREGIWVYNSIWNFMTYLRRVTMGKSTGSIKAIPNPIELDGESGLGFTNLAWVSYRTSNVEIRTGAPDGLLFKKRGISGSEITGKCVQDGMTFYLQDVSDSLPLTSENTLARVTVKAIKKDRIMI